jgi:D-alanyl-D-alanine carboxypeptidase
MRTAVVALCAALTLVAPAHGAAPKRANLGSIARALVKDGAPGALVYVRTPTAARAGVAGYADRAAHVSMRAADRFRIASLTKAFTSVLVLQLEGEGKLDIDDPVENYLPHVVPNGSAITLRELLNHTSGLYDYSDDAAFSQAVFDNPQRTWTPLELAAFAFSHAPYFAPGIDYHYSNTNYVLLGLVVEKIEGKPLAESLQQRIIGPLGLTATSLPTAISLGSDFVHGYLSLDGSPLFDLAPLISPSIGWSAGGIVSNARDVTTFYRALLTGRLLPAVQLVEMETPSPNAGTYGLGIDTGRLSCGTTFGHRGDFGNAWRTEVLATSNGKRQAVVMVNVDDAHVDWNRIDFSVGRALCRG